MLIFKKLTIKNFMSVGEIPQTIDLENSGITLILGENLDMVSDGQSLARNGAGKSAIFNALSFALFGQPLSNIKKDNLINNINIKGMFVIFEFSKNGHNYKIERGRKPNFTRFIVDNNELNTGDVDESQGESKLTQVEIEKILGMSHNLFKHIIALNTTTDPFLKLGARQQREFIEELLGMKLLSEKAETLKELLKFTKDEAKMEEFRLHTLQDSNKKIEKSIEDLKKRSEKWDIDHKEKLATLEMTLDQLSHLDTENEIQSHKVLKDILEFEQNLKRYTRERISAERDIAHINKFLDKSLANLEQIMENKCPTCGSDVHDEKHEHIVASTSEAIELDSQKVEALEKTLTQLKEKIEDTNKKLIELGPKPSPFYDSIDDAYNHKSSLEVCAKELQTSTDQINPYIDQIATLEKSGLQDVDFTEMNELVKVRDHQEFLLKLLTSNDSFIRKKIIDQNIAFLNDRLSKYLEKLALPHTVFFQSDLSCQITNFGRELDFGNLSRGEQTRLILALSFSFRDIFELLTHPVNVVLIDELLDLGGDDQLVESAMGIIKRMNTEHSKDVWVISHKNELLSKIPTVLKVIKEGGFSVFDLIGDYAL